MLFRSHVQSLLCPASPPPPRPSAPPPPSRRAPPRSWDLHAAPAPPGARHLSCAHSGAAGCSHRAEPSAPCASASARDPRGHARIRPGRGASLLPGATCPGASCCVWPTRGPCGDLEAEAGRPEPGSLPARPQRAGPRPLPEAAAPMSGCFLQPGLSPAPGRDTPRAPVVAAPVLALSSRSLVPSTGTQAKYAIFCWVPFCHIFAAPSCLRQGSFVSKGEKYA